MWRCINLIFLWAAIVAIALVILWIETDGAFPGFRPILLAALAPALLLAGMAAYHRCTEKPGPM
jgi:hypothetical protein